MNQPPFKPAAHLLLSLTAIALAAFAYWNSLLEKPTTPPKEVFSTEATVTPSVSKNSEPSGSPQVAAKNDLPPVPKLSSVSLDSSVVLPKLQISIKNDDMEAEAFRVANVLVAKMPNDARALHVAALCNSQLHKTTEAQNLWLKCIELSPKSEAFYLNVAANALYRGDTDIALEILQKATANGLESADITHHLGLALSKLGDDEKAAEVLKKAVQKQPNLGGHWMLLGQSELKLNRLQDAKSSLSKALELGVQTRAVYLALLNTSVRLGEKDEVRLYREKIDELGDQNVGDGREQFRANSERDAKRILVTVLGEAYVVYKDANLPENAEHAALRLLAIEPNHYGTCVFLSDLYRARKMPAEELATRQRMLELNPSDLLNHLQAARILSDMGYPKRCEAAIKTVTTLAPQRALGFAAMAEFLVSQGLFEQAQWYAEQALERERSPGGLKLLESIQKALGKKTETK